MYKIKDIPEDFIVDEIYSIGKASPVFSEKNQYAYYIMEKRNFNTVSAVLDVSSKLKVPFKSISFCGNKDKNAITTQLISIRSNKRYDHRLEKEIIIGNEKNYIKIKKLGYFSEYVFLGFHQGNRFTINIKNISEDEMNIFLNNIKKLRKYKSLMLNLFGDQRFSTNNVEIGKLIVKKDFKKAVDIIISQDTEFGRKVKKKYEKTNDPIVALRVLPLKLLTLYVNSFQSYLWNKVALFAHDIIKFKFNPEILLFGFNSDLEKLKKEIISEIDSSDSNTKKKKSQMHLKIINYYFSLINEENISNRDFVFKQIPQISAAGWDRSLYMKIDNFKVLDCECDSVKVSFELKKSSYATTVMKNLFSENY